MSTLKRLLGTPTERDTELLVKVLENSRGATCLLPTMTGPCDGDQLGKRHHPRKPSRGGKKGRKGPWRRHDAKSGLVLFYLFLGFVLFYSVAVPFTAELPAVVLLDGKLQFLRPHVAAAVCPTNGLLIKPSLQIRSWIEQQLAPKRFNNKWKYQYEATKRL